MNTIWIVLLSVVGTIATLAVAMFAAVIFIRGRHPQEVESNLDEIIGGLRAMGNGAHYIWCFFLIYFWKARFYVRAYIPPTMTLTFLIAGFFTSIEVLLNIVAWFHKAGFAPHLTSHAAMLITAFLSATTDYLHEFYSNPYLLVFLLACETLIALHHLQEHKHRGREEKMMERLLDLFGPLNDVCVYLNLADKTISDDIAREERKRGAINVFLKYFGGTFREIFEERGLKDVNVCVMEQDPGTGDLRVKFESSEGKDFKPGFSLGGGKGAAGLALNKNKTIYVPNVRYEHAVIVTQHVTDVQPRVYEPSDNPFKSMICTPLLISSVENLAAADKTKYKDITSKVGGVLNLSSRRKSAFTEFDFVVARLGATVLTLMYNGGVH